MLGRKLGFTIPVGVFGDNLHIWHYGNIVVNGGSRVGGGVHFMVTIVLGMMENHMAV